MSKLKFFQKLVKSQGQEVKMLVWRERSCQIDRQGDSYIPQLCLRGGGSIISKRDKHTDFEEHALHHSNGCL